MTGRDEDGLAAPDEVSPQYWTVSLRDWFAGQALVGLLARDGVWTTADGPAHAAYTYADWMLAERRRKA